MKDVALYFPTMKIPSGSWLTHTLLYWDQVASIVPRSMQSELLDDPFTAQLIDLGQLIMIDPTDALSRPGVEEEIHVALERLVRGSLQSGGAGHEYEGESRMRSEKMLHSIRARLRDLGYVHPTDALGWIRIADGIGSWYMALLAGVMAGHLAAGNRELLVRPVTSNEIDLESLVGSPLDGGADRYLCRVIHDVLPSPEAPVNPLEIAKFKESHGDELRRLRNWIDGKMFEGSQYEGDRLSQWTRIFRREAEVELDDLVEAMKRRRWPKTVLVGIGGIVASGLNVANALVTGIDAISAGLDIGSAALGLGPAGWALAESLNTSYEKQAPMAYAALATKTFRDAG